jgi:hypothetical protein
MIIDYTRNQNTPVSLTHANGPNKTEDDAPETDENHSSKKLSFIYQKIQIIHYTKAPHK